MSPSRYLIFGAAFLALVAGFIMINRVGDAPDSENQPGTAGSGSPDLAGASGGSFAGHSSSGPSSRSDRSQGGRSGDGAGGSGSSNDDGSGSGDPELSLMDKVLVMKKKGVAVFDDDYQLNRKIGDVLGLNDDQYTALNDALQGAMEQVDTLRAENVEVRQSSDSQLFLKMRSFGEEGAGLQQSLEQDLRSQLGDERYASFMLLAGDGLSEELFHYGRAYQTISFNVYDSQNNGDRRIRIVDRLHVPPQGGGDWAVIENKDNYNYLPPEYAPYFEMANGGASQPIPLSELPTGVAPVETPDATPSPETTPVSEVTPTTEASE